MGIYNPHAPGIIGNETVPIRGEPFPLGFDVEHGHGFVAGAQGQTDFVDEGRFYLREETPHVPVGQTVQMAVYPAGREAASGPVRRLIIPVNGGASNGNVTVVGAANISAALAYASDDGYVQFDGTGRITLAFNITRYDGVLGGRRILNVSLRYIAAGDFPSYRGPDPEDGGQATVSIRPSASATGTHADWPYALALTGAEDLSSASEVHRINLGDTNPFWLRAVGDDWTDTAERMPWRYQGLALLANSETSTPLRVLLDTVELSAPLRLSYAALEIIWCEENRIAVGGQAFGASPYAGPVDNPYRVNDGPNIVTLRDPGSMATPVSLGSEIHDTSGRYTVVVTMADVGDVGNRGPTPQINALRMLYDLPDHPGVIVTKASARSVTEARRRAAPGLGAPLWAETPTDDPTMIAEPLSVLPHLSLFSEDGPLLGVHVYGNPYVGPVWGDNVVRQDIATAAADADPYDQIRFYARRLGTEIVPLTVEYIPSDAQTAGADQFDRTIAGSLWGDTDTGQEWVALTSVSPSHFSVSDGFGFQSISTLNAYYTQVMAFPLPLTLEQIAAGTGLFGPDMEVYAEVGSSTVPPAGATQQVGIGARINADLTTFNSYEMYLFEVLIGNGSTQIELSTLVNGTKTVIANLSPPVLGVHVAGRRYGMRLRLIGPILSMRAWPLDQSEPDHWQLSLHDTTFTGAGTVGAISRLPAGYAGTTPVVMSFANFNVQTILSGDGAQIGVAEFDQLPEIIDGWREVNLRLDNVEIAVAPYGLVQWSAPDATAAGQWQILAADALGGSGVNSNGPATYAAEIDGDGTIAALTDLESRRGNVDATVLLAHDGPTIDGLTVNVETRPLAAVADVCGVDPRCIPTGVLFHRVSWQPVPYPPLYAADSFYRTEVDQWGQADIGGMWTDVGPPDAFEVGASPILFGFGAGSHISRSHPLLDGAGAVGAAPSTSFVAPSVDAPTSTSRLISAWLSFAESGDGYTTPGGMTATPETDGVWTSMVAAHQPIGSSGATGTRTATYGASDQWSAASVVITGDGVTPTVEETLSGVSSGAPVSDLVFNTDAGTQAGWWLIVVEGWDLKFSPDFYPEINLPPGGTPGTWMLLADSFSTSQSWTRIWGRQVTSPGVQQIVLSNRDAPVFLEDIHGRVFVLSDVSNLETWISHVGSGIGDVDVRMFSDTYFLPADDGYIDSGVVLRYVDEANYYHSSVRYSDTSVTLVIESVIDGETTTLASYTTPIVTDIFQGIFLRAQADGSTLRAKAWIDTSLEPPNWQVAASDPAHPAGAVGARTFFSPTLTSRPAQSDYSAFSATGVQDSIHRVFGRYELQRADDRDDWQTIAVIGSPDVAEVDDYEPRVGVESRYRVRVCNLLDFCGPWSAAAAATLPAPGVTGNVSQTLIFTSNVRRDGSATLAYPMGWERSPRETFTHPEAATQQLVEMYGRDFRLALRPIERGGQQFTRTVLVQSGAAPAPMLDDAFGLLRDLAWASDLPYIAVRTESGDRWYANLAVPEGTVQNRRRLQLAQIDVSQVTDTAAVVDDDRCEGLVSTSRPVSAIGAHSQRFDAIDSSLDVRVRMRMEVWQTPHHVRVVEKMTMLDTFGPGTGPGWGWSLGLIDGQMMAFTGDGSVGGGALYVADGIVPFNPGEFGWLRWLWVADNGSGDSQMTFFTSADGVVWSQVGAPVVDPFSAAVANPAPIVINDISTISTASASRGFGGGLTIGQVLGYDGDPAGGGQLVFSPDFASAPAGAVSLVDAQNTSWRLIGGGTCAR